MDMYDLGNTLLTKIALGTVTEEDFFNYTKRWSTIKLCLTHNADTLNKLGGIDLELWSGQICFENSIIDTIEATKNNSGYRVFFL